MRRNLVCSSSVEVPYYSGGSFQDVYHHCGSTDILQSVDLEFYPYYHAMVVLVRSTSLLRC